MMSPLSWRKGLSAEDQISSAIFLSASGLFLLKGQPKPPSKEINQTFFLMNLSRPTGRITLPSLPSQPSYPDATFWCPHRCRFQATAPCQGSLILGVQCLGSSRRASPHLYSKSSTHEHFDAAKFFSCVAHGWICLFHRHYTTRMRLFQYSVSEGRIHEWE